MFRTTRKYEIPVTAKTIWTCAIQHHWDHTVYYTGPHSIHVYTSCGSYVRASCVVLVENTRNLKTDGCLTLKAASPLLSCHLSRVCVCVHLWIYVCTLFLFYWAELTDFVCQAKIFVPFCKQFEKYFALLNLFVMLVLSLTTIYNHCWYFLWYTIMYMTMSFFTCSLQWPPFH